jgi:hypothetical protein
VVLPGYNANLSQTKRGTNEDPNARQKDFRRRKSTAVSVPGAPENVWTSSTTRKLKVGVEMMRFELTTSAVRLQFF